MSASCGTTTRSGRPGATVAVEIREKVETTTSRSLLTCFSGPLMPETVQMDHTVEVAPLHRQLAGFGVVEEESAVVIFVGRVGRLDRWWFQTALACRTLEGRHV